MLSRFKHEFFHTPIRVSKLDTPANREMKHGISSSKSHRIKKDLDRPCVIRADMKALLATINYIGSVDCYIPKIVNNLLTFQSFANASGQSIRGKPDRSGRLQGIGVPNTSDFHKRNAFGVYQPTGCIKELLVHPVIGDETRFQSTSPGEINLAIRSKDVIVPAFKFQLCICW